MCIKNFDLRSNGFKNSVAHFELPFVNIIYSFKKVILTFLKYIVTILIIDIRQPIVPYALDETAPSFDILSRTPGNIPRFVPAFSAFSKITKFYKIL